MTQTNGTRPGGSSDGPGAQQVYSSSIPKNPYQSAAPGYFKFGWVDAIPMNGKPGQGKLPGVSGFTGYEGKPVGYVQMMEWVESYMGGRNIGLRMPEHVVGIDVDDYDGKTGGKSWAAAVAALGEPPATYSTTSRGPDQQARIRLYRLPIGRTPYRGVEKEFGKRFGEDVEIIHRGWRHIMVYPSIHPTTGAVYRWYDQDGLVMVRSAPAVADLPELPEAWVDFLTKTAATAGGSDVYDESTTEEGWTPARARAAMDRKLAEIRAVDRHSKVNEVIGGAARLFGHFIASGFTDRDEAMNALMAAVQDNGWHSDDWNRQNNKGWVAASVVMNGIENGLTEPWEVASAESGAEADPEDRFTTAQMAGRLARELLAGRYIYTTGLAWLRWDGMRWRDVPQEAVLEAIRKWVLANYKRAVAASSDPREDKVVKGWTGLQNLSAINSMATLARGIVLRDAADFDQDPDILNTPTGVVDLRTGQVSAHDPARLITKVTAVGYVPGAESPALKAALEAVPDDARAWLQLRLGEAVTGHSGEQMVLLTGGGRNGKTLLMGAAFRALGGYAAKVPNTLLLKTRQTGGATPERMTLRGVRLAYMEETPEDGYLDANVVKDLLDAEEIEGRHLYRDIVSWRPSHSLFLNTNHPPTMGDTGDGAWRRLARLDFPYRFRRVGEPLEREEDREGDPRLKAALGQAQDGQEALLAWLVAGAARYYEAGSVEESGPAPASVVEAMRRWREESDDLLRFVRSEMVIDPDSWVPRSDMFEAFSGWLRSNKQLPISAKTFGQRMTNHSVLAGSVTVAQVSATRPGLSRRTYLDDSLVSPLRARVWAYAGLSFRADPASDQD